MTAWHMYPALLVLQIHGSGWINTISHIALVYYLVMNCQPSPLTLHLPATSVSLFLLRVHANVTELGLFITRLGLLVRSLLVVLWLVWCFQTVPGNMSHLPAIIIHRSSLLTKVL